MAVKEMRVLSKSQRPASIPVPRTVAISNCFSSPPPRHTATRLASPNSTPRLCPSASFPFSLRVTGTFCHHGYRCRLHRVHNHLHGARELYDPRPRVFLRRPRASAKRADDDHAELCFHGHRDHDLDRLGLLSVLRQIRKAHRRPVELRHAVQHRRHGWSHPRRRFCGYVSPPPRSTPP